MESLWATDFKHVVGLESIKFVTWYGPIIATPYCAKQGCIWENISHEQLAQSFFLFF